MKKYVLLLLAMSLTTFLRSQDDFNSCAAVFSGDRMLVEAYRPGASCQLSHTASTTLSLNEVVLHSEDEVEKKQAIPFKVAIRDQRTETLTLLDDQVHTEIPAADILKHCRPGDHIVLLTLSRAYAVPHPEILVTE